MKKPADKINHEVDAARITADQVAVIGSILKNLHDHPITYAPHQKQPVYWLLDTIETEAAELCRQVEAAYS